MFIDEQLKPNKLGDLKESKYNLKKEDIQFVLEKL